jgi:carbon monoxide dehydrogenase subunit G
MELSHSFTVPVSADEAFAVLTDIERIAPCMPGASIDEVDGDEFTGRVKVKVGPMQVTYRGKAKYAELDHENHTATIEARAQETRGSGTANATISASLEEVGDEETEVSVTSDLAITGRPAQFGRGVMNEVGAKLIGQFADCLSSELAGGEPAAEEEPDATAEQAQQVADAAAPGSNGSSAAASEQEITQEVGTAPVQPATGAAPAAAAAAPSAAAATSGATPAGSTAASSSADTTPGNRATTPRQTPAPEPEPIDLINVAGASVGKRVAPIAAVLALILLIILWRRRRRA